MSTESAAASENMVVRKTNSQIGRHLAITPKNSTMRNLSYGRIVLNASEPRVSFSNQEQETGLICLSGKGLVKTAGGEFELGRLDAIYIPRGSLIEISTPNSVDFAEFSSDVEGKYPLQVVRHADVNQNSALNFAIGGPGASRQVTTLIAKT